MINAFFLAEVLFTWLTIKIVYSCFFHPLARYPGPFLAKFTNLWKLYKFFEGSHHEAEKELHSKYGPIIRIGPESISVASLQGFEAIYGYNEALIKGEFYRFGRSNVIQGSIFTAKGDATYRHHRRKVAPSLRSSMVKAYRPVISRHCTNLLLRIDAASNKTENSQATVNFAPIAHRFLLDTLLEIVYGPNLCDKAWTETSTSTDIPEALKAMSKFSWGCAMVPIFGKLMASKPMLAIIRRPTVNAEGELTGLSALVSRTEHLILEQPHLVTDNDAPSIAKCFLEAKSGDSFSSEEIWRECFNFVFAGPGSTSAALTAILHRLGTPQEQVWQNRILEGSPNHGSASEILAAVIKETLRLDTPFPSAFPRTVTPGAETAVTTSPLPSGTVVSSNTWILGRSKDLWGEDAEEWHPERWLDAVSNGGVNKNVRSRADKFVAFSKGARSCVGKDLTLTILTEALTAILTKWEVSSAGILEGKNFLEMQYTKCDLRLHSRF